MSRNCEVDDVKYEYHELCSVTTNNTVCAVAGRCICAFCNECVRPTYLKKVTYGEGGNPSLGGTRTFAPGATATKPCAAIVYR